MIGVNGVAVREGDRLWIPRVPAERPVSTIWHFDGMPATLRALAEFKRVDQALLQDEVFAALIGQSFRFWFSPRWEDCLAYTQEQPMGVRMAEVLGFDYRWRPGGDGGAGWQDLLEHRRALDRQVADAAWEELREELDAGHPVLLLGGEPGVDPKAGPVVVTGYDDARGLVFFLPHCDWRPAPAWDDADPECVAGVPAEGYRARPRPDHTNWVGVQFAPVPKCALGGATLSFFSLRVRRSEPSRHEVAIDLIRRAVDFARGRASDEYRPSIIPGLPGLEAMAACLEADGDQCRSGGHPIPWARAGDWAFAAEGFTGPGLRRAAAAFLRACAGGFGEFSAGQQEQLLRAAACYEAEGVQWARLVQQFAAVGEFEEYPERVTTVRRALGDESFRPEAARRVREMHASESEAISALEAVLALSPNPA